MLTRIFTLLVVFQLKHFLADFPLQVQYMFGKFKTGTEWILPLTCHAAVHGTLTLAIVCAFGRPDLARLALFDFGIHFSMDRIRASPYLLGRFPSTTRYFWWTLGLDQMVHHLTNYFVIWNLVR